MSTENLDQLEAWLGTSVGDAYTTALKIAEPSGSSPAWEEILKAQDVQPSPPGERARAAAATGQLRGAPPDELFEVLDAIAKKADKKLNRVDYPDDGASERRWRRLQGVIGRLRDETLAAYRKQVMPKKKGGMFGAALASAKAKQGKPVAPERKSESFVMRCEKCGAPRLKNDDFVCEYCDTPYSPDGPSPLE
jgi:hypothetical protein